MKNGIFITFEGGEGSGKTLQSKLLYDFILSVIKKDCILTREPGGTTESNEIRKLLLTGDENKWDPLTESLLYLSSRSDHWYKKINPALMSKKIVICDRFQDSSIVYQGLCKGVNTKLLDHIYNEITGNKKPDRTYLLDIDPKIGIKRSVSRKNNDEVRFEKMDISFHQKVRDSFLKLSKNNDDRFLVIDGSLSIEKIQKIIQDDIIKLFF